MAAQAQAAGLCQDLFASRSSFTKTPVAAAVEAYAAQAIPDGRLSRAVLSSPVLLQDLEVKEAPDRWKEYFAKNPHWQVQRVENSLRRVSLKGEPYQVYYTKWTPTNVKKPIATIIMQHGFGRTSLYFHDTIRLLTYLGYEVITPDSSNLGRTLQLTLQTTGKMLKAPTPVDDANAVRDIIHREHLDKFVLLGHSRGHAVTALVAAMPEFQNRIIAHFPVNPYVMWINDYLIESSHETIDGMFPPMQQNMRWMSTLMPTTMSFFGNNQNSYMRQFINGVALPRMQELVKESLAHRTSAEVIPGLDPEVEAEGIFEVGRGLAGQDLSEPGFSVRALYGIHSPQDKEGAPTFVDNGFGYTGSGITQIPQNIKNVTFVIRGMMDKLMVPDHVGVLLEAPGVQHIDDNTGTHYIPSERPYQLVDSLNAIILSLLNPH